MKAAIIKIGNSQGIRIPEPILKQCDFNSEVELEIHARKLVIKPSSTVRKNWEKAFKTLARNGDDNLLENVTTEWEEDGGECVPFKWHNLIFFHTC